MRKLSTALTVLITFSGLAMATAVIAEKTIKGDGQCAKCSLKETATCQNTVVVEEGGKKVTYYLAQNDISKAFHKNVCTTVKAVEATGDVKEENGKQVMTATKIELVK